MVKQKLEYRFHNPNPEGVLEKYIETILIQSRVEELFQAIQKVNENESKKMEKVR